MKGASIYVLHQATLLSGLFDRAFLRRHVLRRAGLTPDERSRAVLKRLFIEHFGRRLLLLHGRSDTFTCPSNPTTDVLCSFIRDAIGRNGGVIIDTLKHGCKNCTHVKQFQTDLINSGVELSNNPGEIAGVDIEELETPEVRSCR